MLRRLSLALLLCIQFSVTGRSPEQVAEWLEESSWSTEAQYNLGIAYMEGDGVPVDKPDIIPPALSNLKDPKSEVPFG